MGMYAEESEDGKQWQCTGCKEKHKYKFQAERCECYKTKKKKGKEDG